MAQANEHPETQSTASGGDVFPTVWTFERATEVEVLVDAGGGWVLQEQGVAYTVSAGDWLNNGADCVFTPGHWPVAGAKVLRRRVTPVEQPEGFGDQARFQPEQAGRSFDRLTRMVQERTAEAQRAITVAPGETGLELPAAEARRGQYLAFDADGRPIAAVGGPGDVPMTAAARELVGEEDYDGMRSRLGADRAVNILFQRVAMGALEQAISAKLSRILDLEDFAGVDTTAAVASTAALQKAVDEAVLRGWDLRLPPHIKVDGPIAINGACTIRGVRSKTVIDTAGAFDLFTLRANDITIEDLVIGSYHRTAGFDFVIDTGAGGYRERIDIRNTLSWYSKGGIKDIGTGHHTLTRLKGFHNRIVLGPTVAFTRALAFLKLDDVVGDYVGAGAAGNVTAITLDGTTILDGAAGGAELKEVHILSEGLPTNTLQHGVDVNGYKAVTLQGSNSCDNLGGKGWRFRNTSGIKGDVKSSLCWQTGVEFENAALVDLHTTIYGRRAAGDAVPATNVDGMVFKGGGCNAINVTVGNIVDMARHAVSLEGTQAGPINIVGGVVGGNGGRGVKTQGASAFQWTGFIMAGNAAGNYDLASALHHVEGVYASGSRGAFAGPGVA